MIKMLKKIKKNNLKIKSLVISFAFCMILILPVFINSSMDVKGADNAAAGSSDDPLVTLSYINKVFKPQIEELIEKTAGQKAEQVVTDKLKDFKPATNDTPTVINQNTYVMSDGASSAYVALELTKGQKLRAKSGSLELILRPGGTAVVISDFQTQGLADLTSGEELLNGQNLPVNHSLLIPRADSRGVSVTSVIAYLMVRGDFEIID